MIPLALPDPVREARSLRAWADVHLDAVLAPGRARADVLGSMAALAQVRAVQNAGRCANGCGSPPAPHGVRIIRSGVILGRCCSPCTAELLDLTEER